MDPVLISLFGLFCSGMALLPAVWLFDKVEAWWHKRAYRRNHPAE